MREFFLSLLASLILFSAPALATPRNVGQTAFAKGEVLASHPEIAKRALNKGLDVYLRDLVETGDQSFSVLEFLDKGRITVRPLSQFNVYQYSLAELKAVLNLEQGGVQVEVGAIGESSPQQLVLDTPLAEVGAQQGKYRVRLCRDDCAMDEKQATPTPVMGTEVVARVVEIQGQVVALTEAPDQSGTVQRRQLAVGAPIYRADQLLSSADSHLLMVFRDGGRISLGANSEMRVKDYRWQEQGYNDGAVLRLVRGGLRAVTGNLGKENPNAYTMETPVGLIGIRGTAYDLLLEQPEAGAAQGEEALYTLVRDGAVDVKTNAGNYSLQRAQGNRIAGAVAQSIEAIPNARLGPEPESVTVDLPNQFGREGLSGVPQGLYLFVDDGHVMLKGKLGVWKDRILHLGRHEAAYVDSQGRLIRMDKPRDFQVQQEGLSQLLATQPPVLPPPTVAPPPPPSPPPPPPAATPPPRPICAMGSYWSEQYGQCLQQPSSTCGPNQYYNAKLKKCLDNQPVCNKNQYYSKKYRKCVDQAPTCNRGETYSTKLRRCVSNTPTCKKGYFLDKQSGQCVKTAQQSSGTGNAVAGAIAGAIVTGILINAISNQGSRGGHSHPPPTRTPPTRTPPSTPCCR